MSDTGTQQHPIGIYLQVWLLLFVLSTLSYLVDWFQLQGVLRWSLILLFMFLKAGLIMAVFMHLKWERLALKAALLLPPLAIVVAIAIFALEGDYTVANRAQFFEP